MTEEGRQHYSCYDARNHKCINISVNFLYGCVMQLLKPDAFVRKKFMPLVIVLYTSSASQMLEFVCITSQLPHSYRNKLCWSIQSLLVTFIFAFFITTVSCTAKWFCYEVPSHTAETLLGGDEK